MPRIGKFRETERSVVARGLPGLAGGWGGDRGITVNVSSVWGDEDVLELDACIVP